MTRSILTRNRATCNNPIGTLVLVPPQHRVHITFTYGRVYGGRTPAKQRVSQELQISVTFPGVPRGTAIGRYSSVSGLTHGLCPLRMTAVCLCTATH